MARRLAIACLQTRPRADFEGALAEALGLAGQAAAGGAQLIALPEYCGGLATEGGMIAPPAAAEADHPVVQGLRAFARDRGVWLLVGSVAVPGPAGRVLNRGLTIAPDGAIAARYDKIHMFDIQLSETEVYRESARVAPGAAACLAEAAGARIGHTICYDLRFPALYRDLAQAGAEILAVPAAFTRRTGEAHWHVLNRARAIENGAFVVSPCAIGPVPGGGESYGHSLIVGPWGEVLADGGTEPGVVAATIDLDAVAEARAKIPSLTHDRAFAPAGASGTGRAGHGPTDPKEVA
ncbi:carbon-nitrogen hydrolase family protein [Paralimibaculum aggregatum]|uniref:Carbon-nitrogen hydrolase family protein n=1 Tax=Paralimibaculum aggregatum TaxID=3036245 RepID=A0ABQ6LS55_9RHOB|nr:nitrilase-related carbon-nitrogen hydrolase [Limibaculum sp. NKW23]GMG84591.1 carbon-nitrogen hydrolase family protein [Limibaculum sp. NKW23]